MRPDMHVRSDLQLRWSLYPLKALRAQTPHTASLSPCAGKPQESEGIVDSCTGELGGVPCTQRVRIEIPTAWSNSKNRRVREKGRGEVDEKC